MGLHIKSDRVHALAREAARRTGRSQTSVIEEALLRLMADLERSQQLGRRRASAEAIAHAFRARLSEADRKQLATDMLMTSVDCPYDRLAAEVREHCSGQPANRLRRQATARRGLQGRRLQVAFQSCSSQAEALRTYAR